MTRRALLALSFLLLFLGIGLELGVRFLAGEIGVRLHPGQHFSINVAALRDKLEELWAEERPQQLADWALYGTALSAGLTAEELRDATYDRAPFREPALMEVVQFEHGSGRRLILSSARVWLFYAEGDPQKVVTLGRLADQVRMELGELPATLQIFRYRSELARGVIHVEQEADAAAEALLSAEYGYGEWTVRSPTELSLFLGAVDELTYARLAEEGGVILGGRSGAPGSRLGLAEVATLYQVARSKEPTPGFALTMHEGPAGEQLHCARYRGPLEGTAVGMTLFYTDLLAKLWAGLDLFAEQASDEILGLATLPGIGAELDGSFWEELGRHPRARLWFAQHPAGQVLSGDGQAMYFAPQAVQMYAAGVAAQGSTAPIPEDVHRVVRFWERHYAAIAAYEPQYEVLNQLMKWSALAQWLVQNNRLAELGELQLAHEQSFAHWYAANPQLRLRQPLALRSVNGEECLAALRSAPYEAAGRPMLIEGGIELGASSANLLEGGAEVSKIFLAEQPLLGPWPRGGLRPFLPTFRRPTYIPSSRRSSASAPALRRSSPSPSPSSRLKLAPVTGLARGKQVHAESGRLSLTAQDGVRYELPAGSRARAQSVAAPAQAPLSLPGSRALRVATLHTAYLIHSRSGLVQLSDGRTPLGGLRSERTAQGVQLTWQEGAARPSAATQAQLELQTLQAAAPGNQLRQAVTSLRRGRTSEAARSFAEASTGLEQRRLQLQGLQKQDVQQYLAARAGQPLKLTRLGYAYHTEARLPAQGPALALDLAGRAEVARQFRRQGGEVYVQESPLLGSYDWDGQPGPSLSQVARNPRFVLAQLDVSKLGPVRPSLLVAGQERYVRRSVPAEGPPKGTQQSTQEGGQDAAPPRIYAGTRPPAREARPRYLVRSCEDRNRDGKLDEEELRLCHLCERDQAGRVKPEELGVCPSSQ